MSDEYIRLKKEAEELVDRALTDLFVQKAIALAILALAEAIRDLNKD